MTAYILFAIFLALDIGTGEFNKPRARSLNELGINIASSALGFTLRLLPLVVIGALLQACWPAGKNAWAGVNPWLVVLPMLLVDDYANYWLHRSGHNVPWLWNLHRTHHTPTCMNITMSIRTSALYYLLVPVNALAPLMVYAGAVEAAAITLAIRLASLYLQHAGYRWDLALRRYAPGRALLNFVESFLALQDYHHAHHGVGRYGKGSSNYGNLLNLWDKLHGTSMGHPHCVQDAYGLPGGVRVPGWGEQMFWPLVRARRAAPRPVERSTEAELAQARAIIHTADGTAVAVRSVGA